jgi:Trk K+ transport system NAD-binding subunit
MVSELGLVGFTSIRKMPMELGFVGLGKMGKMGMNMVERLCRDDHEIVAFDIDNAKLNQSPCR